MFSHPSSTFSPSSPIHFDLEGEQVPADLALLVSQKSCKKIKDTKVTTRTCHGGKFQLETWDEGWKDGGGVEAWEGKLLSSLLFWDLTLPTPI